MVAHIIRRTSTKLFRAVYKLSANFRWCLTGTPIQNRLEDIGSIVAFLRVAPFDEVLEFRRHIVAPILNNTDCGTYNLRILLDSICLRRTKVLLDLPDMLDQHRILDLSDKERSLYESTEKERVRAIKQQVMAEKSSKTYLGIFQLQLQLRLICNHGTFSGASTSTLGGDVHLDPGEAIAVLEDATEAMCVYCEVTVSTLAGMKGYVTTCGHLLCSKCVPRFEANLKLLENNSDLQCPLCPKLVSKDYLLQSRPRTKMGDKVSKLNCNQDLLRDFPCCPTKVSGMIDDIEKNISKGKG